MLFSELVRQARSIPVSWKVHPVTLHQFYGASCLFTVQRYVALHVSPEVPAAVPRRLASRAAGLRSPAALGSGILLPCLNSNTQAECASQMVAGNIVPLLVLLRPVLPSLQPFHVLLHLQAV